MLWLYNFLWFLALPGITCYLGACRLLSGKYRHNLRSRLGLGLPLRIAGRSPIWVHALSVGEVLSALPLIQALREEYPSRELCFSTTTESGQMLARGRLASQNCRVFYLPLDLWWLARRVVRAVNAGVFILVETDLWPNLLCRLKQENIPVVLVNGRLSDRSFSRYRRLRRFFGPVFGCIDTLGMQTEEDARRMRLLGVDSDKIKVTGNLKFDQPLRQPPSREREGLISRLGWSSRGPTWIAGSTHPGEEEIVLRIYSRLKPRFPDLNLVLAPRNAERFDEVAALAQAAGWPVVRRSRLPQPEGRGGGKDVLILDTLGELSQFYSLGTFAFLGGSLVQVGGHNPLEAAQRGIPVVFGPHMQNFREISFILQESGGCFQVNGERDLQEHLESWLANPEACREQGKKARRAILAHQGAVERNMKLVRMKLGG